MPAGAEAGDINAPTYNGTRRTAVWDPAVNGAKALSAAVGFEITSAGTSRAASW
jgi:hypothetical protein